MNKFASFFVLALIIILSGFFLFKIIFVPKNIIEFSNNEEKAEEKELSLDQKIGQLFIIGIKGSEMTKELEEAIKEIHPGGILLLGENVKNKEQLKELISSLQNIALEDTGIPLFIAADQEGGIVSRISWADKTPQSEIKDEEEAHQIGKKRGQELKDSFINVNFAPLLDQSFSSDFIFERAFKDNIAELSKGLIRGQKESGIFSTIKHFPGYGGITFNPEDKLAVLDNTPDISQFIKASEAGPEFVMVSNVVYKDFDNELPFSFLPKGIDYLKENIKGDYLIVSDDLSQYSLLDNFSLEEVVSKPFNAGIDVLIFSGWRKDAKEGIKAFKDSVEKGEISAERIEESFSKITKAKENIK